MNVREYFQKQLNIASMSQITWAHAVNSEVEFVSCLNDGKTIFIEADVGLTKDGTPIMAHPPDTESDLTLKDMIERLKTSQQGIKLDFKEWRAVDEGIQILHGANLSQPVILNADILRGNGAQEPKIPAQDFIKICKQTYPQGIMSLGWTTEPNMSYTERNVNEMVETVKELDTVLFPVRASLVQDSWLHLLKLIPDDRPGWMLSFWNAKEEPPTPEFLNWLKNETKPGRALYDFMDENKKPILVDLP